MGRNGSIEEPGRPIMVLEKKNPSMQTERTIHRNAEAIVGVGFAGSTQSVGKPHTRGSGGAELGLR